MELAAEQRGLLGEYVEQFGSLIGDQRTGVAFEEIVRGIISAESLVCQRIAAHSGVLSAVKDDGQSRLPALLAFTNLPYLSLILL